MGEYLHIRRALPVPALVVVAAYLVLAVAYGVTNPLFEAPDEHWHFFVARHIASGQGLPVLRAGMGDSEGGPEAGQPPLYYLIGGGITSWIPRDDLWQYIESNPAGSRGYPDSFGNKNVWVQLTPDSFPWRGEYLAAHLLRLYSTFLGALTVLCTYAIARDLFPSARWLPVAAASLNAFVPQFLFITAAVTNDAAAALAGSACLLFLGRAIRPCTPRTTDILLGVSLGVAALCKLSLLIGIPFALAALSMVGMLRRDRLSSLAIRLLLVAGVAVVVAGWWYARNLQLYGDLTGLKTFLGAVGGSDQGRPTLYEFASDAPGLFKSFWALFGWFSIEIDSVAYTFYGVLSLASLAGIAWWLVRARRSPRELATVALPAAWLALVLAALVQYRTMVLAFQGRLLFPAVSAVAILIALGLWSLPLGRLTPAVISGSVGIMLAIAIAVPGRYLLPAYAPPEAAMSASNPRAVDRKTDVVYGDELELVGYSPAIPKVESDGKVRVDFYWRALGRIQSNYVTSVQLLDYLGTGLAQDDSYPGRGAFPTSRWREDELVRDTRILTTSRSAAQTEIGSIVVSVYRPGKEALTARNPQGAPVGVSPVIGHVRLGKPLHGGSPVDRRSALGAKVSLIDFSITGRQLRLGDHLSGTLSWQALERMDTDYTVFVQIVGVEGPIGQSDSQPRAGAYPTSYWEPGEIVADTFSVQVPYGRSAGQYRLIAGMYDVRTGKRLANRDSDYLDLGTVDIRNR